FPHYEAGEEFRRAPAYLRTLAAEVGADIQRAVSGHGPTTLTVFVFEGAPDNEFTVAHATLDLG
ncbi:MAG: hypothetical protein WAK08_12380, partial [Pseudolabrys sp.]